MVAGEAIYPRKTIKTAFKTMYFRFGLFFIMGALCVGIILPSDDPTLTGLLDAGDTGTGASSPYVIAMKNMGISVLPDLTNALMVTSIFSAGTSIFTLPCVALDKTLSNPPGGDTKNTN